jgi:D-inositol-3-phosphate glycosyltransferase
MSHSVLEESPLREPLASPGIRVAADSVSKTGQAVALLTGGQDKSYAFGLCGALVDQGVFVDFIGSNEVDSPHLHGEPRINYLNLRGDQSRHANRVEKAWRLFRYYARLVGYAITARPKVFHVLWNERFVLFDRTLLMFWFRANGRRVVYTAHNVNAGARDDHDTFLNRFSLKVQYGLAERIFVHTEKMKSELLAQFGVPARKVSIIPFGINDTVPNTNLTREQARQRLGLSEGHKTLLFFGRITPYKGLEDLVKALGKLRKNDDSYRLLIVGAVKDCADYWRKVQDEIERGGVRGNLIERIEFIPEADTELYFKAADVLVLPYRSIFQSGVLVLGYNFGLPVIAADVGSFKEDVVEGRTGYICPPADPGGLAQTIERYFASDLRHNPERRARQIKDYASERFSWTKVGEITAKVYADVTSAKVAPSI